MSRPSRRPGGNDLDAFFTANNLADSYRVAERLDEAIPLAEQTLADRRQVLGDDHPDTVEIAASLTLTYSDAERWDDAISLYERTLSDSHRVHRLSACADARC